MIASITDALVEIREIAFDRAPADLRFAFDFAVAEDVGGLAAGPLFDQDGDFVLFESEVDDTRRAGVSEGAPTRAWGTLTLSLFTKNENREIPHLRQLEEISRWFADQTLREIRFRTFTPARTERPMGFTAYCGTINFDFDFRG
ncbi:hypothetical protein D9M68_747990 [compost metagenome]